MRALEGVRALLSPLPQRCRGTRVGQGQALCATEEGTEQPGVSDRSTAHTVRLLRGVPGLVRPR